MGERKAALFLASLPAREQKRMLSQLPKEPARRLRLLIAELRAFNVPLDDLAQELLAAEVSGLTEETSPAIDQIMALAKALPRPWFARALVAWGGVNRTFILELLDAPVAAEVRREIDRIGKLPPKLAEAVRSEAMALAGTTG